MRARALRVRVRATAEPRLESVHHVDMHAKIGREHNLPQPRVYLLPLTQPQPGKHRTFFGEQSEGGRKVVALEGRLVAPRTAVRLELVWKALLKPSWPRSCTIAPTSCEQQRLLLHDQLQR